MKLLGLSSLLLASAAWVAAAVGLSAVTPSSAAAVAGAVSYDGYKVYRVNTHGNPTAVLTKLSAIPYDTWSNDDSQIDIAVSPDHALTFESFGLDYSVMHDDLGSSIRREHSPTAAKWDGQTWANLSWYDNYHQYDDHIRYFDELHRQVPNNSALVSSGISYEGRSIFGLHLWGAGGPGKPAVLYHGTVHAREWISAPVVEYLTFQLITTYHQWGNGTGHWLDSYDFYIFPIVNPDGFIHSQTNDRLWRKNRQPPPARATTSPLQDCFGRDINRNWAYGWDTNPAGASTEPCSQVYKGESPSDSPENQGLDAFMRGLRDLPGGGGIKLFVDWHSYGQYILYPFGNRETLYAPELGKWTKAAAMMSQQIRAASKNESSSTTFTFGPSGVTLYLTTGTAPDHAYAVGRAAFAFTIELPDTGNDGFILPAGRILPAAEEQWAGQQLLFGLLDEEFFDGVGPV